MQKKTIVLVFTTSVTLVFFDELFRFLKEKGFHVLIVCNPDQKIRSYCKDNGLDFYPLNMSRKISPVKDIFAILKLTNFFKKLSPEIVHVFTPKASLIGIMASFLANIPKRLNHIMGIHYINHGFFKRTVFSSVDKMVSFLSTMNLTVSPSCKEELLRLNVAPASKISVLKKGSFLGLDALERFNSQNISMEARREFRKRHELNDDDFIIGFVGRLNQDKGVEDLLKIYKELPEENIKLVIVGAPDSERSVDDETINEIKKSDIIFTGWLECPEVAVSNFNLLIHPSKREGFGNVIIEAAALEVPALAYNIPGVCDAIESGHTGYLVEFGNWKNIVKYARSYYENKELLDRHSKQARTHVLKNFSSQEVITELYEKYYN